MIIPNGAAFLFGFIPTTLALWFWGSLRRCQRGPLWVIFFLAFITGAPIGLFLIWLVQGRLT